MQALFNSARRAGAIAGCTAWLCVASAAGAGMPRPEDPAGAPLFGNPDRTAGRGVVVIDVPGLLGRQKSAPATRAAPALNADTPGVEMLIDPILLMSVVGYGGLGDDGAGRGVSPGPDGERLTDAVAQAAGAGSIPMLVGGTRSMLYHGVKGVARVHGAGGFGLIHLSTHPDAGRFDVHTISDEQALFRVVGEKLVNGGSAVQVGLRGIGLDGETARWLQDQGVRYHTMADIRRRGYEQVLSRALGEVARGPDRLFISVDLNVIGRAEPLDASAGLPVRRVVSAVRELCATKDVVGVEITDMAPQLGSSERSARYAGTVLDACVAGITERTGRQVTGRSMLPGGGRLPG